MEKLILQSPSKTMVIQKAAPSSEEIEAELQYYALRGEKADIDVYNDENGDSYKVTILE